MEEPENHPELLCQRRREAPGGRNVPDTVLMIADHIQPVCAHSARTIHSPYYMGFTRLYTGAVAGNIYIC